MPCGKRDGNRYTSSRTAQRHQLGGIEATWARPTRRSVWIRSLYSISRSPEKFRQKKKSNLNYYFCSQKYFSRYLWKYWSFGRIGDLMGVRYCMVSYRNTTVPDWATTAQRSRFPSGRNSFLVIETYSNHFLHILTQLSTCSEVMIFWFWLGGDVILRRWWVHHATELKVLSVLLRKHTLLKISGTAKISSGFNQKCDFWSSTWVSVTLETLFDDFGGLWHYADG